MKETIAKIQKHCFNLQAGGSVNTSTKLVKVERLPNTQTRLEVFNNATFEAVLIHEQGKILDVNPAAETLFGYSTDELIGKSLLDVAAVPSYETIRQRLRSPSDQPFEAIALRKDKTTFIAEVSAKSIVYQGRLVRVASVRDITERKQAEERVKKSEEKNRALLNAIPDLMFIFSKDGKYLDFKAEKASDLIVPPDEIVGKFLCELMPTDVAQLFMHHIEQAISTRETQNLEYHLYLNGIKRDWEARLVSLGEEEVVAIVREITQRKQVEEALRVSEEKFKKAFSSSPESITISTVKDGRYIDVNETFLNISGYTREQVIGHNLTELQIWVNPEERLQVIKLLQEDGAVRNQEYEFRKQSGEVVIGLFSAEIINLGGEECLLTVGNDITERKQAEIQQRMTQKRDRLLAETLGRIRSSLNLEQILNTTVEEVRSFLQADRVFIGHTDGNGKGKVIVESVNSNYPSILGWVLDDESSLADLRTMFEENCVRMVEDTSKVQVPEAIASYHNDYQVKSVLAVPISVHGQGLLGALIVNQCSGSRRWEPMEIDLLEQLGTQVAIAIQQASLFNQVQALNANLECQVQERTAQLEQKIEEVQELYQLKDIFLHAVSHDLRTPIVGGLLVLQNLLMANRNEQLAISHQQNTIPVPRSILERMIQSSDRQLRLINSLLEVHTSDVRGVVLHREPTQIGSLVQAIVEDFEPLCAKNHAFLTNQVEGELPSVNADPLQLRRVFENLLTNALNHNPPGLKMTIKATVKNQMMRCTIEDDGVGMNQETCDRAFELYARGSQARRSTGIGLGLYLCQQIIIAHGGEIGVISSPGDGATFWFTLPLDESFDCGY
ncbi:PAS domain S-box protein [Trichocoleus sp. FACHB-90]|uniref:PAS domain S-box protein n=1 Tax=Cyanophyceae TaxID=3028117 RepID=UPI001685EB8C|nr:PAS domain S-box protein [Trichocoleus sp. FACHB-90]MBD1929020.1 PAS domain S-box protein [Trichocoleus sp. FACHB-90]